MNLNLESNKISNEGASLYGTMLKTVQVRQSATFSTISTRLDPAIGDYEAESYMERD